MGKDPAFLFYPGDWLGGTTTFNRSHKGAYMDLLMAQFSQWSLPLDDVRFLLGVDFDSMWESKLKAKFKQDPDGAFYNQKLRDEVVRRKSFTASRNKNLEKSPTHMHTHMQKHMETETGNENINVNINKKMVFRKPTLQEVVDYCKEINSTVDPETFFHTYESSGWIKANGQKVANWKSTIRTWEKKDKKTVDLLTDTQKRNIEKFNNWSKVKDLQDAKKDV